MRLDLPRRTAATVLWNSTAETTHIGVDIFIWQVPVYMKPFSCPHCLQRPDVKAHLANPPPSQPLQVDIPDGTGQWSGLTQGIQNMNISDPVRKAPESSAKTVLEDIRAAQYQLHKFIPKASRTNSALALSSTISKIVSDPSDVDKWRRLSWCPKSAWKPRHVRDSRRRLFWPHF